MPADTASAGLCAPVQFPAASRSCPLASHQGQRPNRYRVGPQSGSTTGSCPPSGWRLKETRARIGSRSCRPLLRGTLTRLSFEARRILVPQVLESQRRQVVSRDSGAPRSHMPPRSRRCDGSRAESSLPLQSGITPFPTVRKRRRMKLRDCRLSTGPSAAPVTHATLSQPGSAGKATGSQAASVPCAAARSRSTTLAVPRDGRCAQ